MLSSIEFVILNTIMSVLSAYIVYYMLSKKAEKTVNFYKNLLKNDAEAWLNSETGAKALYGIGMMIGQGAKQSIGIGTKGGKFKWKDMLIQMGLSYVQKKVPGLDLSPGELPQNLNNQSKDKRTQLRSA